MSKSKRICTITVIVALCLGSNYALSSIPNFKVMDFFVFISGFIFGPWIGASTGILVWMIYGVINPYGFVLQVWLATMLSEAIYGLVGGILGKKISLSNSSSDYFMISVILGVAGFILTLVYDFLTNIAYALAFNIPIIVAIVMGVPFTLVHEISNAAIFGICTVPLLNSLQKFIGGERIDIIKK
ncbi:MAG: ECF transporter S component [Candidatus Bathyarchaeia archaeon]